jgi:hypothetical protein
MQSQSRELEEGVVSRHVSGEDRVVTLGDVTFHPGK